MILNNGHSTQYLNDYLDGKIPTGLKLGCDLDDYYTHKNGQLNIILGHDNVGKTYFMEWYFLALATNHDLKFCLFMDENFHGKIMRDLIQMYAGKKFMTLSYKDVRRYEAILEQNFKFIDNTKRYSPDDLLNIFEKAECDVHLIDPFNGLKTPMNFGSNYDVLNDLKHFTKEGKTIYINAHPSSASGRRSAVYPEKHGWAGHVMPPLKSDIEGGKAFPNKADDFIIIHRLTQHPDLCTYTMVEVVKIKDTDTGGKPTMLNEPIMLDYNFGLGFKINGKDVIKRLSTPSTKAIQPNNSFDLPF
jgi:hypothetical protein